MDTKKRKEELLKCFERVDGREVIEPILNDVIYLETQLEELRKLPMIRVNPADPSQQKATPAVKIYKDMVAQYNGIIKTLTIMLSRAGGAEDDSPLRSYLKSKGQR